MNIYHSDRELFVLKFLLQGFCLVLPSDIQCVEFSGSISTSLLITSSASAIFPWFINLRLSSNSSNRSSEFISYPNPIASYTAKGLLYFNDLTRLTVRLNLKQSEIPISRGLLVAMEAVSKYQISRDNRCVRTHEFKSHPRRHFSSSYLECKERISVTKELQHITVPV